MYSTFIILATSHCSYGQQESYAHPILTNVKHVDDTNNLQRQITDLQYKRLTYVVIFTRNNKATEYK